MTSIRTFEPGYRIADGRLPTGFVRIWPRRAPLEARVEQIKDQRAIQDIGAGASTRAPRAAPWASA